MKNTIYLFIILFVILGYTTSCQDDNYIKWSQLKIIGTKKVETTYLGTKNKTSWPIFDEAISRFDGKVITIEGYYFSMSSMDFESLKMKQVYLLTIAEKPTIKICGVPQFKQNEFIRLEKKVNSVPGKKITVSGILRINKNGSNGSLLSMDNPEIK